MRNEAIALIAASLFLLAACMMGTQYIPISVGPGYSAPGYYQGRAYYGPSDGYYYQGQPYYNRQHGYWHYAYRHNQRYYRVHHWHNDD